MSFQIIPILYKDNAFRKAAYLNCIELNTIVKN